MAVKVTKMIGNGIITRWNDIIYLSMQYRIAPNYIIGMDLSLDKVVNGYCVTHCHWTIVNWNDKSFRYEIEYRLRGLL